MTQILEGEWSRLEQLRERFLAPFGSRTADYWSDERLCELYDATFAQRIAWKWSAVLAELARRGRLPRAESVLDWGCGTAIAAREYCAALGSAGAAMPQRIHLWDRSRAARAFAAKKLHEVAPQASIETELPGPSTTIDLLLVSHVLGELDEQGRNQLLELARRARAVVWVEPGDSSISRSLMELRDQLAPGRSVLGPCTHSATCGLNQPGRERDWCHFFAASAPEVFTRADWREFSRRLKIDLRSVPYAYFALGGGAPVAAQPDTIRILGRPRLEKGHAKIDACDATGVRVLRVLERDAKAIVKGFADPAGLGRTYRITTEKDRVRTIEESQLSE